MEPIMMYPYGLFSIFAICCTALVGILFISGGFFVPSLRNEQTKYPNGPRPLGFLGNFFTLSRLLSSPDQELLSLARRFGDLCMLWYGSNPVMIINTPRAARDLLTEKGAVYSSRPEQNEFRSQMWPYRLVTTPAGENFRFLRKLYHSLLSPQRSGTFRKYQDYESKVMLGDLLDHPQTFLHDTERFAISVIFSAVYGVRLADLKHPIMTEFYAVWERILQCERTYPLLRSFGFPALILPDFQPGSLMIDFFPMLHHLPKYLQPWTRLALSLRDRETSLHRAFLRTLQKLCATGEAPDCFGKMLVEVQKTADIDDDKAVDILAMLIGAGADTTSSVLQSFFKVMALHPEAMRKAHHELDEVVGPNRLPTWDDEQSLPYIRGLIKELHRWGPIGSLGIPHATTRDDKYNCRTIPKGTIVFPNLTALSRDAERYPNPEIFEPLRFHADTLDASASALQADHMKRDHFHYGFGRRLCQGIFVAEASLYIVISRVLWGFDIKAKPGHVLDMNAKIAGLVTKPKPFEVVIESRGPTFTAVLDGARGQAVTNILDFDDVILQENSINLATPRVL